MGFSILNRWRGAYEPARRMSYHVLGIDLGGSNLRVALGDRSGRPIAEAVVPTAKGDAEAVVDQLADGSRELVENARIRWAQMPGMAVGVRGVVQVDGGELRLAPNLPPFTDVDVAGVLAERLALPV